MRIFGLKDIFIGQIRIGSRPFLFLKNIKKAHFENFNFKSWHSSERPFRLPTTLAL